MRRRTAGDVTLPTAQARRLARRLHWLRLRRLDVGRFETPPLHEKKLQVKSLADFFRQQKKKRELRAGARKGGHSRMTLQTAQRSEYSFLR